MYAREWDQETQLIWDHCVDDMQRYRFTYDAAARQIISREYNQCMAVHETETDRILLRPCNGPGNVHWDMVPVDFVTDKNCKF